MARIAILGGTGSEGLGLGARFGRAGEEVILGSRSEERAAKAVERLRGWVGDGRFSGTTNDRAAAAGDVVFVTVPFAGLDAVIDACRTELEGKIVVDTVVPLRTEDGFFDLQKLPEGSAAEYLQARLPRSRVVAAFKNQSAEKLLDLEAPLEGDVVVCGEDDGARQEVSALVRRLPGLRPIDGGRLRNGRPLEAMTALLLNLNRRHGSRASFRLTGL